MHIIYRDRSGIRRWCRWLLILVLLWTCHGRLANAQNNASASVEEILDRAVSAFGAGDYSEAEAMLLRIRERAPNHKEIAYWLGCTYRKQRKWEQAIQSYTRVYELDPRDSRGPAMLGQIYLETNRPAEAARWYRLAAGLAPADEGLLRNLKQAENAMNARPSETTRRTLEWGLVSYTQDDIRIWADVTGVVAFLVLPVITFFLAIKGYRIPLTPGEWSKVFWLVALTAVVCAVVAWGWHPHWRMAVWGPAALLQARMAYVLARRMSIMCVARVVDGVARMALLARFLQAMRRNAPNE